MRVFLAVACAMALAFNAVAETKQLSGAAAPDFTLKSRGGKNLRLEDLRGQVVMLNFWASWCGPCRQEMPLLDELYQRYSRAGFTILGVNVDADPADANGYLKKTAVSFPIVYDTESTVSRAYDVGAMPTTIMVDRNGKLRYQHKSYKAGDEEKYRQFIRELIKE